MASVYTVAQVTSYIRHMFEEDFLLSRISVQGEISNYKRHSSGHMYFTMKDERSSIRCILFAAQARRLSFEPKEGMQVIAKGSIRIYERDGTYQLYVDELNAKGRGQWYQIFEERRERLAQMGMFAAEYKKPIPPYCMRLGVVTAPTGAAIHDIINISTRRNPHISITLYPALVQGAGAADSIVRGIGYLDRMGLDCLIVGRGGGSIEDLWAFNEEEVAMAIFQCETPVISAVGHETDFTIADFVADLRAPTPSAAAELAVFDCNALLQELADYGCTMEKAMRGRIDGYRRQLENSSLRLELSHPRQLMKEKRERLQQCGQRLEQLMRETLLRDKNRLAVACTKLEALSPLARLRGGYAFLTDKEKRPVRTIGGLQPGDEFLVHMSDGIVEAKAVKLIGRQQEGPAKEADNGDGYDNR